MVKQGENSILTPEQMRMADQYTMDHDGFSVADLMERAGQAISVASNKHKRDGGRIVIVVGKGNNAGDGFVAARLLRKQQIPVTVIPLLPLDNTTTHVSHQIELAKAVGVKIRPATTAADSPQLEAWLNRAVLVVDAVFGTGLTRPITGWLEEAITLINQANCPVLAVDIASGIDANSGQVLGAAINADVTLPIAAYKWGHWLQQGREHSGLMLTPASIGIRIETIYQMFDDCRADATKSQLIDMAVLHTAFPKRSAQSFKHTFGHLWVFGGSIGYTGAPKLAALGAQAVATGLVSMACSHDIYSILATSSLEVMVHPQEGVDWQKGGAVLAGPGWGKQQQDMLGDILQSDLPAVLDADALNMLAESDVLYECLKSRKALTVLTPHAGEAARLLNVNAAEIQQDRLSSALALVDKYHVWVVLKGAQTLIVSPQKEVWVNPFGSVNLATAGTGDVLAGMIGGLLAGGLAADTALPAAVALHGLAGEEKSWFRAGQLADLIAAKVQYLRKS
ncbi:MAG: NAD(P)H-hydrate dehydratase [Mariprofundaceae bacterium]|nr:NAD(P)H-hydrate dehydratase [Mariprofundaceae bacterium]